MGETTSEYIHILVNTILFCSAIGMLVMFLSVLSMYNKNEIDDRHNKSSIMMDTQNGYDEDQIFVLGSEVFTNIMDSDLAVPLYLDAALLDSTYLTYLREGNKFYINDLKARISMDAEYLIQHSYDVNNQISAVYFKRR